MNRKTAFIMMLLLAAGSAHAGFRDPVGNAGQRPKEVLIHPARAPAPAAVAETARAPASILPSLYGPPPPSESQKKAAENASHSAPAAAPQAQGRQARPAESVPTAPGLPSRSRVNVPSVNLPGSGQTVTIFRDPMPPIELNTRSKEDLHKFSREARNLPLPSRTYDETPRSPEIAARFAAALSPYPHKTIRTPVKLSLQDTSKIKNPPSPIQYENMVKRLDALFDGFYLKNAAGMNALWQLSQSESNARNLQARDALFAGILGLSAGWETLAGNLFEESAVKRIDREERYLRILWNELQAFESSYHVDRVIAKVNPVRVKVAAPWGDKANYAMARRVLAGRPHPAFNAEDYSGKIGKAAYRERLEITKALSELRKKDGAKARAIASLQHLEEQGVPEVREEARLALARALIREGDAETSLNLYRKVTKTGKNRLEVLGEQAYAEFKSGLHQDSLGKAMGLQSPYFQYGFSPDIHLIEIMSRKALCDFGGAEAGIQRFAQRYVQEAAALQELLSKTPAPGRYYEELISYHGNPEPMRFQRYLLRQASVMNNQKVLNSAQKELDTVDRFGTQKYTQERPAGWDEFALAMRNGWNKKASQLKAQSASDALAEAEYMLKRLRHTFAQVELLSLDVSTSATRNFNLQSALNFPVRKPAQAALDKEKLHWPFEDEIWEDELDFLKMKNPSKCASVSLKN